MSFLEPSINVPRRPLYDELKHFYTLFWSGAHETLVTLIFVHRLTWTFYSNEK